MIDGWVSTSRSAADLCFPLIYVLIQYSLRTEPKPDRLLKKWASGGRLKLFPQCFYG